MSMKNYQGYNDPLEEPFAFLSSSEDEYPAQAAAAGVEEQPMVVTADESDSDSCINPSDHASIGGCSSSKSPKGSKRRLTPSNQNTEIRGEQFWI